MQGSNNVDPLLSVYTRTTNFSPLQQAIQQAQQQRLGANYTAQGAANNGLNNQAGALTNYNNQAVNTLNPYSQIGVSSMQAANGLNGAYNPAQYQQIMNSPVLQAIQNQGIRALNQGASANGMRFSGGHMKDLMDLGQQNASQYIQQLEQNNANLAQLGQQSSNNIANFQSVLGTSLGNVAANRGNVDANAALARGEIQGNASIDAGKTAVAQSSVAGLQSGQIANPYGNNVPLFNPNINNDPWASMRDTPYLSTDGNPGPRGATSSSPTGGIGGFTAPSGSGSGSFTGAGSGSTPTYGAGIGRIGTGANIWNQPPSSTGSGSSSLSGMPGFNWTASSDPTSGSSEQPSGAVGLSPDFIKQAISQGGVIDNRGGALSLLFQGRRIALGAGAGVGASAASAIGAGI